MIDQDFKHILLTLSAVTMLQTQCVTTFKEKKYEKYTDKLNLWKYSVLSNFVERLAWD